MGSGISHEYALSRQTPSKDKLVLPTVYTDTILYYHDYFSDCSGCCAVSNAVELGNINYISIYVKDYKTSVCLTEAMVSHGFKRKFIDSCSYRHESCKYLLEFSRVNVKK
jgi:hypothetical protein